MSQERRLQELENCLLKLDADRISLLREIQSLREEIALEVEASTPLLGLGQYALAKSMQTGPQSSR
jgi:hypothetical protein